MIVMWSPSGFTNFAWASVAYPNFYFGRKNTLGLLIHDTIVRIYYMHLYLGALNKVLDSWGYSGNYDIFSPYGVRFPSSSRAPR